jgi:hypothetical protein
VTSRRRPMPADMLLVAERRRRLTGSQSLPIASEEILISDEDQLIPPDSLAGPAADSGASEILLHRPMAHVTLTQVGWSGPIDHAALQSALSCQPKDLAQAQMRLGFLARLMPAAVPDAEGAALEVALGDDDVAVMAGLASSGRHEGAPELLRAALLPDRLSGAETTTMQAVSHVLGAYRHAALEDAWHRYLGGPQSAQLHRERDEAAVAVLSTLRALLGER